MLATNLIALVGGASFYHCEKGECLSVLGSLLYLLNFISMLVLFVYAQLLVFGQELRDCNALL